MEEEKFSGLPEGIAIALCVQQISNLKIGVVEQNSLREYEGRKNLNVQKGLKNPSLTK